LKRDRKVLVIESAACGGRGSGRGKMGDFLGVRGLKYLLLLCCMTFSVPCLYNKITQIFPSFLSNTKCLETIQNITGSKKGV